MFGFWKDCDGVMNGFRAVFDITLEVFARVFERGFAIGFEKG